VIKTGDPATADLPARPGEQFRVDRLSVPELIRPPVPESTGVVKNLSSACAPVCSAAVHLRGTTQNQVLTVPTEAVINRTRSVVIVSDDGSPFRPLVGAGRRGTQRPLRDLEG